MNNYSVKENSQFTINNLLFSISKIRIEITNLQNTLDYLNTRLTGGSKATLSPRVKGGQPTDAYIIIDEIEAIKEVLLEKQKEFTFYTAKLERKISCLKHLQHKIMWLRYVEGLSFANISEQMNLELRYCRRLYQCAMKILEKNL